MIDYLLNIVAALRGGVTTPADSLSDKKNQIAQIISSNMESYKYMAEHSFYDYIATVEMHAVDQIAEL